MISEITVEDDALFECQVGATEQSQGLASRRAKLTVQGYYYYYYYYQSCIKYLGLNSSTSKTTKYYISDYYSHLRNGLFSRTTRVSQYQKGKPFWVLMMMGWQWHQLDHMQFICTSLQTEARLFRIFS